MVLTLWKSAASRRRKEERGSLRPVFTRRNCRYCVFEMDDLLEQAYMELPEAVLDGPSGSRMSYGANVRLGLGVLQCYVYHYGSQQ